MSEPIVLTVADDTYLCRWAFCIETQDAYAHRFGFGRQIQRTPHDGLNMQWSKVAYAAALLERGHAVLLLDADAEIADTAPSFTDILSATPGAGIFYALGVSQRANSGVLMLRGEPGLRLTKAWLAGRPTPVAREHLVTRHGENGHLIALLASGGFDTVSHVLPLAWNCSQPEHAATAHVRHYTNQLRRALATGAFQPVATPLAAAASTEAALLEAHRFHRLARPVLANVINRNPAFAESYRAAVTDLAGRRALTLPPLVVDDANAWLWRYEFASGLLDLPSRILWERLLGSGGVVFDGGAHVGYFSLPAAGLARTVVAVEPHPDNFAALRRNVGAFATCIEAALGAQDAEAVLVEGMGHSNSTLIAGHTGTGRTYPVRQRSIDSLCRERGLDHLDLLKLDLEGFEPDALAGAEEVLAASPGIALMLECNPRLLGARAMTANAAFDIAARHGLIPRMIQQDFALGAAGVIDRHRTRDYLLMRRERWDVVRNAWRAPRS